MFYKVTLFCFAVGVVLVYLYAPWSPVPGPNPFSHQVLGYAPVWSGKFAGVPGSRVSWSAFTLMAGAVGIIALVVGGLAESFQINRKP
jgi:phage shock protein PspC (stress-responsive transcriptional regulator)